MAKRQRSVSLSFVLLRFAIVMLGSMLLCCLAWLFIMTWLENKGIIYRGYTANQQVEQMLAGAPKTFDSPEEDFLSEYALFDQSGRLLESNAEGKKLTSLAKLLHEDSENTRISRYTYEDRSTVIVRWDYRKEFADPTLRNMLPPAEYLWWIILGLAWILCLLFSTMWLRRRLAAGLKQFNEVGEKVGAQELDFTIPHVGIREYDQALDAMEDMRQALYSSLSSQWAAQQEREAEIAALAHDLKTPLTLVGGNAELLLGKELPESSRIRVEKIVTSNERAKQYVASLLEASVGAEEICGNISLWVMFEELCQNVRAIAEVKGVSLQTENSLGGSANIQKERLLRAIGNVVQNAMEHTPAEGTVYLESGMTEDGWQILVRDEGFGFSKEALRHATERLWRDDAARSADGHNGIGLWFAAEVVKSNGGQLELCNWDSGGVVKMSFCLKSI